MALYQIMEYFLRLEIFGIKVYCIKYRKPVDQSERDTTPRRFTKKPQVSYPETRHHPGPPHEIEKETREDGMS